MSDDVRITMERLLHRAAAKAKQAPSPRVQHVMALVKTVKADNAFDTLIGEIDKMISVVRKTISVMFCETHTPCFSISHF